MTDTIKERAREFILENRPWPIHIDDIAEALTAFAKEEVGRVLEMAAETCEGLADEPAPSRGVQRSTILRSAARAIRALKESGQ